MKAFVVSSRLFGPSRLNPSARWGVPFMALLSFLDGSRDEEDLIDLVKRQEKYGTSSEPREYNRLISTILPDCKTRREAKLAFCAWMKIGEGNPDDKLLESERFNMLFDAVMWEVEGKLEAEANSAKSALEQFQSRLGGTTRVVNS